MRKSKMVLKNENAAIQGARGAVFRAFTCEGTKAFVTDCHLASVRNKVAKDILFPGGVTEGPKVDALNEQTVDARV